MPHSGQIHKLGTYDVVVCGGGMAGVGAACAAARAGAHVLLVERLEVLGGLGTSGGVGNFCFGDETLPGGQGRVLDDIWDGLAAYRAIGEGHGWRVGRNPPFFNHTFDHNVLAIVLQELAEADGVELLFATDVIGADAQEGHVRSAILHNRSLCQRVEASIFVDATGDGILSRHAGAPVLPPDGDHPQSIPPSHMIYVQPSEDAGPQVVRRENPGEPVPQYSVWTEPDRVGLKMWWRDGGFDTSTGQGYSDAGRAFRRRIPEFVRHFQGTKQGQDSVFAYSASMLGLRDSVRVEGDYVLTADDLRSGRSFPDAVAHGCFPLDSAAITKEAMPPYQIPYGCLCVKSLTNVLVAGRCFSATRVALSSARIMVTCCLMGQAAGAAAAMACEERIPVRRVAPARVRRVLAAAASHDDVLRLRLGE
ncbi:MAG: FAD-dependent oxidoreductase [Lentisphaerae bacterium]|jgi:hypothetical protein|nr:FAD-dependent oxidoreductase [Lentisphaerota bacterium]MBT4816632.1 FAD-dependent oxidoreductase [Lentisphaerota bacterium]MBT5606401.1 FAD-dependent oxidoreductase [Lentisphaerota bacterium]MBT7059747.1 FAD-dependent oxidoreductase [Lentisphaerota bacterium]MBT7847867.1 FAD-dependent oxidoreductase [Lentisphaerota bacterium]